MVGAPNSVRRARECGCCTSFLAHSSLHRLLAMAFLLSVVSAIAYMTAQKLQSDILHYRVGGNLRPSTKDFWKKLARAPQVWGCSYTSCPTKPYPRRNLPHHWESNSTVCPTFFQWIFEDLRPWMTKGISRSLVESARKYASFRVIIVSGRLFLAPYHPCYQTRAFFTVWGLVQLLEFYPNLVPDVDLMFSCEDAPRVSRQEFKKKTPPPVFRYCSTVDFFDIPFPDWSFWGWPEINVEGWETELRSILKGANRTSWEERRPLAHWKGNPFVAPVRMELLKCNDSSVWNAEIFVQDWIAEGVSGFSSSKLSDQCKHRYKIYAEGSGWSVGLKYMLACGSTVLSITPKYYDFFSRGLVPLLSIWPVRSIDKMCDSIKFAVGWGNSHPGKAKEIGRSGQEFIEKEVSMKHVYDYMLGVLTEYAKLQKFKPGVVKGAGEVCGQVVRCLAGRGEAARLDDSRARAASSTPPCQLRKQHAMTLQSLKRLQSGNLDSVTAWEDNGIMDENTYMDENIDRKIDGNMQGKIIP